MDKFNNLISQVRSNVNVTYLDSAAMSLIPSEVQTSIKNFHYNRAAYGPNFQLYWDKAKYLREQLSNKIHCNKNEIMFTLNTSMGINLAANSIPLKKGDNVIISDIEFPSNVYPWLNLENKGIEVRFIKSKNGVILVEDIINLCDENTKAISLSWVQASNGFTLDLEQLGIFCENNNIYFIVDAIQGLGVLPLDLSKLKIDFLVSGFFKWLLGPDGLAFVYINNKILDKLYTPYAGWASMKNKFEYTDYNFNLNNDSSRFETGNLNFSGIYGASKALELTNNLEILVQNKIKNLNSLLRKELSNINGIEIKSNKQSLSSGIILFDSYNSKKLHENLCSNNIITSYRNGIRASFHFYNEFEDIEKLINIVKITNK